MQIDKSLVYLTDEDTIQSKKSIKGYYGDVDFKIDLDITESLVTLFPM